MKETFYFSHDYNARSDGKLVKVMMKHGIAGIGAYWCIIEMLYEEGGYIGINEYDRITFELRTTENVIHELINDYGLFDKDEDNFWSNSVLDRLKQRMDKSEKARISVQKRWDNKNKKDTIVLQTNYDSNTIKERKGKEIKGNERKELELVATQPNEYQESISFLKKNREHVFTETIEIPEYVQDIEEWHKFIGYWTEIDKKGKMRSEGEKTFEIKRRFATWMSRKKETYQKTEKTSVMDITL